SGSSSTDNITNVTTPHFAIGGAPANATVSLVVDGGTVASGSADGSGNITLQSTSLANGLHHAAASTTDVAGNVGSSATTLALTVDTIAPPVTTPDLDADDDLGISDTDNITSEPAPFFTVMTQ